LRMNMMISYQELVRTFPNCHAMLHRRKPPFTPEELKALMDANKSN
ncbi:hypothetical protein, partial [Escherichia coli]